MCAEPTALLRCPFCGGEPTMELAGTGGWRVECESLTCDVMPDTGSLHDLDGADLGAPNSQADAIAKWNRRAPLLPESQV